MAWLRALNVFALRSSRRKYPQTRHALGLFDLLSGTHRGLPKKQCGIPFSRILLWCTKVSSVSVSERAPLLPNGATVEGK